MPHDAPEQLLYVVNRDDYVIGSVRWGGAYNDPQVIHRAICVIVINNNRMLFKERGSEGSYPNFWALSCVGHVPYGVSYREAAEHELDQELNIKSPIFLVTKLLIKTDREADFVEIYTTHTDNAEVAFDQEKFVDINWVDIKLIADFTETHQVIPADEYILKQLMYIN